MSFAPFSRKLARVGLNLALSPLALLLLGQVPASAGSLETTPTTLAHDHSGMGDMPGHGDGHDGMDDMPMDNMPMDAMPMPGHGDHDHSGHGHGDHGGHHHGTLEVSADMPAPTLAIAIEPDTVSGWNLELITENFELTGDMVGDTNMDGEGHAHVYANGIKLARVYGNWFHIPELPAGEVELRVTLNSNQHQELTLNGETIEATATVMVMP
ncbi:MAG: hypothetical protein ACFB9N_00215 [Geitlerinemataceae cyanobacterium]